MMNHSFVGYVASVALLGLVAMASAEPTSQPGSADWPCWRGPTHDGVVPGGPKLLDTWPAEGPDLLWRSGFVPGSSTGSGMGQPVVAEGKVFLYLPWRHPVDGGDGSKGYVPITSQFLRDCGYVEGLPEDLAGKIEDARVSPKKPKVIDHYSLSFVSPEKDQYEKAAKIITDSPGLEAYINDFLATLDPKDVEKYGSFIKMRLCHYGSSDGRDSRMVSWAPVKKLEVVKGKAFLTTGAFEVELRRLHLLDGFGGTGSAMLGAAWSRASNIVVDTVICLDGATGKEIWKKEIPFDGNGVGKEFGSVSTVAVSGGKCYVAGLMGLYCLSANDGALLWQVKGPATHSSPLVAEGVVIYGGGGAAYDAQTGRLLWKGCGCGNNSPVLWACGGRNYVLCGGNCLDLHTGKTLWTSKYTLGGGFTPAISGDILVAHDGAYKLTAEKAELLWKMPAGVADEGACPMVYQDHLYWLRNWYDNPVWHCVDLKTGEVKWKQNSPIPSDTSCSSAVLADGKLFHPVGLAHALCHYQVEMLKPTPDKYTPVSQFNPEVCPMSSPAIAGGKLYLRVWDGVTCYDLAHCKPKVRKSVGNTITLRLERPIDRDVWKQEKSYAVAGATIAKVEVDETDPCLVRLATDRAWKALEKTTIKCPALSAEKPDATTETEFTLVPGRPVVDFKLQEFLVGEVRPNVKVTSELDKDDLDKNVKPVPGDTWKVCTNETGTFNLSQAAGRQNRGLVHACVYVYSDADRRVQLWGDSIESMAIFVNGKSVYVDDQRHFDPTVDRIKAENVSLAKGWNTVLVGVTAVDRDLIFCLRIRDEHGHEPPTGLWYSTELPADK